MLYFNKKSYFMTAILAISLAASFTPVAVSADNSIENILNEIQIKIQEIQTQIEGLHTQIQSQISNDKSLDNFIAKPKENLTDVQTAVLDENQNSSQSVNARTNPSYTVFGGGGGGGGKSEEAPRPKAFIKILTPNGGEELRGGETYTIKWESEQVPQVYIKLRKGEDTYYGPEGMITDVIKNEGFYEWIVPGTLPPSKEYSIRVLDKDAAANGVFDDSDEIFKIIPSSFLNVLSLAEGEVWQIGEKRTIQWEDSGDISTYGVEIWRADKTADYGTWSISSELPKGTNSFEWTVGSTLTCLIESCPASFPDGLYVIEVFGYTLADTDKVYRIYDYNNAAVKIVSPPAPVPEPAVTVL